jgi:hypothetical protein
MLTPLDFALLPLSPEAAHANVRIRCAGWNTDHRTRCRLGRPVTRWEPHLLQRPIRTVYDGMCDDCAKWWAIYRETTTQPSPNPREIRIGNLAFIGARNAAKGCMPNPLSPLHQAFILRAQIAQELVLARADRATFDEINAIKSRWCQIERRYQKMLAEKLHEMQQ